MNGIIYMYTSPSGKSYIGQTNNEDRRKKEHEKLHGGSSGCPIFYKAIQKYGFENFKYKVLHKKLLYSLEMNMLEEMEIIRRNTLVPNGYNLKIGGLNNTHNKETCEKMSKSCKNKRSVICLETQKIYESAQKAYIDTGIFSSRIIAACKMKQKTAGCMNWRYYIEGKDYSKIKLNTRYNRIICLNTKIVYDSIGHASKELNINSSNISQCLSNIQNSAGGFDFRFYDSDIDYTNIDPRKTYCKKVICIDTGIIYNSITEASLSSSARIDTIIRCCKGKLNTAGKLHWAYA